MVQPKVAVPYHASPADFTMFAEILSREAPKVRCVILKQGRPYKYP